MASLLLEVHVIDRRTGVWCDHCLLPSVVEIDASLVNPSTLHVLARSTCWACHDCGRGGTRPRTTEGSEPT